MIHGLKKLRLIAGLVAVSVASFAGVITDPYPGTGGDVIGALEKFDIRSLSVNVTPGAIDTLDIIIEFNYNYGDTTLGGFPNADGTRILHPGDVLFGTGPSASPTWKYGIAIANHGTSVDHITGSMSGSSVMAGILYGIAGTLNAQTVLQNPNTTYRPAQEVWMDPAGATALTTAADLTYPAPVATGNMLTLMIRIALAQTPELQQFLTDLPNMQVMFSSATCGNDVISGPVSLDIPDIPENPVPEPSTMALGGAGLVALALVRKRS